MSADCLWQFQGRHRIMRHPLLALALTNSWRLSKPHGTRKPCFHTASHALLRTDGLRN